MAPGLHAASRPPRAVSRLRWVRRNLLSTVPNTLLTLLTLAFLVWVGRGVVSWAFRANWAPVLQSLKLFALGQFPVEQVWRVGLVLGMVCLLMGISWGRWGGTVRTFAIALALGLGLVALLPIDLHPPNADRLDLTLRLCLIAGPVLVVVGRLLGRRGWVGSRLLLVLWLLSFGLTLLLLRGLPGSRLLPQVETGLWGGLLLTFLLAVVGIVASFPIGVLLALGRRSSLPVVKIFCTLFIELVRGVPLVTILFMFSLILPLFLPANVRIDRVLRAMLAMTFFAAAYMAENVRGGLQSIPKGQIEAAKAVGLSGLHTMLLIVLPQALRAVIPAIVGQFIALFMDTTLAIIVGLVELLAVGKAVLNSNVQWLLLDKEVYLFIAAVFWIFTYSMSYASRRLEKSLGVGER
jgi:general L-amino acid transport system permease protein